MVPNTKVKQQAMPVGSVFCFALLFNLPFGFLFLDSPLVRGDQGAWRGLFSTIGCGQGIFFRPWGGF
jgi:hypothetical protein